MLIFNYLHTNIAWLGVQNAPVACIVYYVVRRIGVGNEICSGTERENFKPGTTGTESIRTDKKDTTDNATHV